MAGSPADEFISDGLTHQEGGKADIISFSSHNHVDVLELSQAELGQLGVERTPDAEPVALEEADWEKDLQQELAVCELSLLSSSHYLVCRNSALKMTRKTRVMMMMMVKETTVLGKQKLNRCWSWMQRSKTINNTYKKKKKKMTTNPPST